MKGALLSVGPLLVTAKFCWYWPSQRLCGRIAAAEDADPGVLRCRPLASSERFQQLVQCTPGTIFACLVPADAVGAEHRINGFQVNGLASMTGARLIQIDPSATLHRQAERDATRSFNRQQPIHTSGEPFWQGKGFVDSGASRNRPCDKGMDSTVAAAQHPSGNRARQVKQRLTLRTYWLKKSSGEARGIGGNPLTPSGAGRSRHHRRWRLAVLAAC